MVKFRDHNKFYSRNSNGKYLLDIGEIRNLFTPSESAIERIRSFRTERLSRIVSGQTPIQIENYPKVILHIVPLSISNPAKKSDLSENNIQVSQLLSVNTSTWQYHFHLHMSLSF